MWLLLVECKIMIIQPKPKSLNPPFRWGNYDKKQVMFDLIPSQTLGFSIGSALEQGNCANYNKNTATQRLNSKFPVMRLLNHFITLILENWGETGCETEEIKIYVEGIMFNLFSFFRRYLPMKCVFFLSQYGSILSDMNIFIRSKFIKWTNWDTRIVSNWFSASSIKLSQQWDVKSEYHTMILCSCLFLSKIKYTKHPLPCSTWIRRNIVWLPLRWRLYVNSLNPWGY